MKEYYVAVDEFGLAYVYDDKEKLIADVIQEQRNYDNDQTEEVIVKESESTEDKVNRPKDFYLSVSNADGYCTSYYVYVRKMNSGIRSYGNE
jgi:hypothetical protein